MFMNKTRVGKKNMAIGPGQTTCFLLPNRIVSRYITYIIPFGPTTICTLKNPPTESKDRGLISYAVKKEQLGTA